MSESILESVKLMLDLQPDFTDFDGVVMMHINSAFSTLTDLGIGPSEGYFITGPDNLWVEAIGTYPPFARAKSYIYQRVRMLFDPPTSPQLLSAMKEQIAEAEWRLSKSAETAPEQDYENVPTESDPLYPSYELLVESGLI